MAECEESLSAWERDKKWTRGEDSAGNTRKEYMEEKWELTLHTSSYREARSYILVLGWRKCVFWFKRYFLWQGAWRGEWQAVFLCWQFRPLLDAPNKLWKKPIQAFGHCQTPWLIISCVNRWKWSSPGGFLGCIFLGFPCRFSFMQVYRSHLLVIKTLHVSALPLRSVKRTVMLLEEVPWIRILQLISLTLQSDPNYSHFLKVRRTKCLLRK